MKTTPQTATKPFQKTDVPCLYRYTPNGVYYALFKHEGKQKRVSLGTTDKATAKGKLGDERADLGKVDASQGKLTLAALCDRYLATIASQATETVNNKTAIVRRFLADFTLGEDAQVSKVKPSDLQGWLAGYGFAYATYNHYVQVIKSIFAIAVADEAIVASPAADMKYKKVERPVRVTPSYKDFTAIIANVRKQKYNAESKDSADYLEFMGLVGVGQAEASNIEKQHVNFTTKQLTFFRMKTKTPYVVPIFPQAAALIKKLVSRKDMKPRDLLFPINHEKSTTGTGTSTKDARKSLEQACERLKLPRYTQRSLRHMFVTRCIEKGIDVKVIAQWQGHQDGGKLILSTYSHVSNTHAADMAKLLAA